MSRRGDYRIAVKGWEMGKSARRRVRWWGEVKPESRTIRSCPLVSPQGVIRPEFLAISVSGARCVLDRRRAPPDLRVNGSGLDVAERILR